MFLRVMSKTKKDVTIYDIAAQLDISVATVSRALRNDPVVSDKTKKRVFDLAENTATRPISLLVACASSIPIPLG